MRDEANDLSELLCKEKGAGIGRCLISEGGRARSLLVFVQRKDELSYLDVQIRCCIWNEVECMMYIQTIFILSNHKSSTEGLRLRMGFWLFRRH